MDHQMLQAEQEQRCALRLQNDAEALAAAASERMEVLVNRFGERVRDLAITMPHVTTVFFHLRRKEVVVRQARMQARIFPNAGNTFPYPLGPPMVQVFFPALPADEEPWLSGLWWIGKSGRTEPPPGQMPDSLNEMMAAAILKAGQNGVGIPCLWRQGEWNWGRDLIFVAEQLHLLLTDPGAYSPRDAMNRQAADYWTGHKAELPLEPPIPEISRSSGASASNDGQRSIQRLKLVRLE
jgi:hypothetical protein